MYRPVSNGTAISRFARDGRALSGLCKYLFRKHQIAFAEGLGQGEAQNNTHRHVKRLLKDRSVHYFQSVTKQRGSSTRFQAWKMKQPKTTLSL